MNRSVLYNFEDKTLHIIIVYMQQRIMYSTCIPCLNSIRTCFSELIKPILYNLSYLVCLCNICSWCNTKLIGIEDKRA